MTNAQLFAQFVARLQSLGVEEADFDIQALRALYDGYAAAGYVIILRTTTRPILRIASPTTPAALALRGILNHY